MHNNSKRRRVLSRLLSGIFFWPANIRVPSAEEDTLNGCPRKTFLILFVVCGEKAERGWGGNASKLRCMTGYYCPTGVQEYPQMYVLYIVYSICIYFNYSTTVAATCTSTSTLVMYLLVLYTVALYIAQFVSSCSQSRARLKTLPTFYEYEYEYEYTTVALVLLYDLLYITDFSPRGLILEIQYIELLNFYMCTRYNVIYVIIRAY